MGEMAKQVAHLKNFDANETFNSNFDENFDKMILIEIKWNGMEEME